MTVMAKPEQTNARTMVSAPALSPATIAKPDLISVEQAKALCRTCPIRDACLTGALEREEPWGVWGGEVFVGGRVVATKRGRGRPRKQTEYPAA